MDPGDIGGWVPGHRGLGHLDTWLERLGGGLVKGGGRGERISLTPSPGGMKT